ncbi:MAG: hypothetical protein AAF960_22590 [Bacteroidota bacterium]
MAQYLFAFLLFPLLLISGDPSWEEYQSYDGKFRVMVPGAMQINERMIYTDIGEVTYITHYYQDTQRDAENAMYMVAYCDYPEHTIHSDSTELVEDFFANTLEAAVESVSGELRYSDFFNYREYPGRHWRIDYRAGHATLKTRAFLVKNRFYTIQTATERGRSMNSATDTFLDSFALLME